uniref:Chromo domain-containing protein n=1 Tax=Amphimedon queenslandica TaxID=400682 RepID=A0A1X7VJU8_AMPQE
MAHECKQNKTPGFYKEFLEDEEIVEDVVGFVTGNGAQDSVYEVERLVEKRIKKGHTWYLVLWKGYSKEEASWVPSKDITSFAIRLYNEPEPSLRVLLDDISSLRSALQNSLKSAFIHRTKLSITFHRHSFNFLFKDMGWSVRSKPGKLYDRSDFSMTYFEKDFSRHCNKHSEGCQVVFPIYMYSHIVFHPKSFNSDKSCRNRSFSETLTVGLVKRYTE